MSEARRGKFISIHGIDGTGKTSTAEAVANSLNDVGVPSINYDVYKEGRRNPHLEKKQEVDRTGKLEDRLAVYLESMMYHSNEIESLLAQGFHVVKSRYLDDICAHFAHLGVGREKIEELQKKFPIIQPDLKVILQLTENERRRRIIARGVLDEKDLEEKKPGSRLLFFEDYLLESVKKSQVGSVLHVDTGTCDLHEVSRKIIDRLLAGI